jgi:hypothetical protein
LIACRLGAAGWLHRSRMSTPPPGVGQYGWVYGSRRETEVAAPAGSKTADRNHTFPCRLPLRPRCRSRAHNPKISGSNYAFTLEGLQMRAFVCLVVAGAAPDEAFSADRRGAFDSNDDRVDVVEVCEVAVTCDER